MRDACSLRGERVLGELIEKTRTTLLPKDGSTGGPWVSWASRYVSEFRTIWPATALRNATVVRAQSWRDSPASMAPRRGLRPQVATRSKWARIEALLRNRTFATEYAGAREQWRNGLPTVFSPGTYWLHRFASVPVLET